MKNFISNPKLSDNKSEMGLISLKEGQFYFSFNIPATLDTNNFDLSFSFQENDKSKSIPFGFSISDNNLGIYKNEVITSNNKTTYLTYLSEIDTHRDITFFEDIVYIHEPTSLSGLKGEVYPFLRSDSPSLNGCSIADSFDIWDNNKKITYILPVERDTIYTIVKNNTSGKYRINRKMTNKTVMFTDIYSSNTKYYYNSNNIFNSAKSYDWKLIISAGGKELSIFTKNKEDNTYTKRETILYEQNIENCFINLSVDDKMTLNNCSFRFFKANIS